MARGVIKPGERLSRGLSGLFRRCPAGTYCHQGDQEEDASSGKDDIKGTSFVHRQSNWQARHISHWILHCAAVDIIICHHHPFDGQKLLIRGKHEPRLVDQELSTFEPPVCRPGSIVMGAVEDNVLTKLQH